MTTPAGRGHTGEMSEDRSGHKRFITVIIHGQWMKTPEEVQELLDAALCERGLCGCRGPWNGYTMSVTEDKGESTRSVPESAGGPTPNLIQDVVSRPPEPLF